MKKIALTTFGCRANQYDTGALGSILQKSSHEIVDFESAADVYIINSCAITAQAETEAEQTLRRIRRRNPDAITILTGCAAQVSSKHFQEMEGVDYVIGNLAKDQILSIIDSHHKPQKTEVRSGENTRSNLFFEGGVHLPKRTRSFLKIQDGCSQFCSFCIVPFARGLNRSIEPERILESLRQLLVEGVREVVLTGIHLGTYGKDLIPKVSLMDLLARIEREPKLPLVRLSSIDPEEVTDGMIELLSSSERFCPHVHLPLQSGDDGVLKKMRRRYTASHFAALTEKLAKKIPGLCIGTDVIVGFPGEDEAAFQNTVQLLKDTPVSYVHTFPYSPRQGTKAALFDNQVDPKERKRRSKIVRDFSEVRRAEFHNRFIGRPLKAILQDQKKNKALTGNYISVEIQGQPDAFVPGNTVTVQIDSVTQAGVVGSILN